MKRLITILSAIFIVVSSCGKFQTESSPSTNAVASKKSGDTTLLRTVTSDTLEGVWSSGCIKDMSASRSLKQKDGTYLNKVWVIEQLTFLKGLVRYSETAFEDAHCSVPTLVKVYTRKFSSVRALDVNTCKGTNYYCQKSNEIMVSKEAKLTIVSLTNFLEEVSPKEKFFRDNQATFSEPGEFPWGVNVYQDANGAFSAVFWGSRPQDDFKFIKLRGIDTK